MTRTPNTLDAMLYRLKNGSHLSTEDVMSALSPPVYPATLSSPDAVLKTRDILMQLEADAFALQSANPTVRYSATKITRRGVSVAGFEGKTEAAYDSGLNGRTIRYYIRLGLWRARGEDTPAADKKLFMEILISEQMKWKSRQESLLRTGKAHFLISNVLGTVAFDSPNTDWQRYAVVRVLLPNPDEDGAEWKVTFSGKSKYKPSTDEKENAPVELPFSRTDDAVAPVPEENVNETPPVPEENVNETPPEPIEVASPIVGVETDAASDVSKLIKVLETANAQLSSANAQLSEENVALRKERDASKARVSELEAELSEANDVGEDAPTSHWLLNIWQRRRRHR